MTPLRAALLGLLAGIAAKAADESGVAWAAALGSQPAAWVLAVAALGRWAPSPRAAAVRAAAFFAAMTVAYYAWAAVVLGFAWTPGLLAAWLVLSATAVPVTAAAAWQGTRADGPLPGALVAGIAGIALAGGDAPALWPGGADPRPVQAAADIVTAVLLTAVLPRCRGTRAWALALVVPATAAAAAGLHVLRAVLG
ncbi:hypothetical protein ACI8AA_06755 [Geodermatophilus sp. SYSU D01180]